MGTGAALVVGISFGFILLIAVALWIVVRGSLSTRSFYIVFGTLIVGSTVLAISTGSLRSAIVLTLGVGVGLALSSLATLPLRALYTKRHGGQST